MVEKLAVALATKFEQNMHSGIKGEQELVYMLTEANPLKTAYGKW